MLLEAIHHSQALCYIFTTKCLMAKNALWCSVSLGATVFSNNQCPDFITLVIQHQTDFQALNVLLGSVKTMALSDRTSKLEGTEVRIAMSANGELLQKSPLPCCMDIYLFCCLMWLRRWLDIASPRCWDVGKCWSQDPYLSMHLCASLSFLVLLHVQRAVACLWP